MPTFREFLASLPPEEQAAYLAEIRRLAAVYAQNNQIGPVLGSLARLGTGTAFGLTNAAYGLATLPLAATNALGLTDIESARRPLVGPGGSFLTEGPYTGNAYRLGDLLGFITSMAVPSGAGQVSGLIRGGGLLSRAARGATGLGLEMAARTPGTLGERAFAGVSGIPAGAAFGLAGRYRGVIGKEGEPVVGLAAERLLRGYNSLNEAVQKGAVTGLEPLSRYIFRSAGRGALAGAAIGPLGGGSPVDVTGNPIIDSTLFNSLFFGASAAAHRGPPPITRTRKPDLEPTRRTEDLRSLTGGPPPTAPVPPSKFLPPLAPLREGAVPESVQRELAFETVEGTPPGYTPTPEGAVTAPVLPGALDDISRARAGPLKYVLEAETALKKPEGARHLRDVVASDLRTLSSHLFDQERPLRVHLVENQSYYPGGVAAADPFTNTVYVAPRYFTYSPAERSITLLQELSHIRTMFLDLNKFDVPTLVGLFNRLGYPARPYGRTRTAKEFSSMAEELSERIYGEPDRVNLSDVTLPSIQTYFPPDHPIQKKLSQIRFYHVKHTSLARDAALHKLPLLGVDRPSFRWYPYTDPIEYVAGLAEDYALLGRTGFDAKHGEGVSRTLELLFSGARNAYAQGVTNVERSRQLPLFPEEEVLGPPKSVSFTIGNFDPRAVQRPLARFRQLAFLRNADETPLDESFREALFAETKTGMFYDDLTARAEKGLTRVLRVNTDSVVTEAIDRVQALARENVASPRDSAFYQERLTETLDEIIRTKNADVSAGRRKVGRVGEVKLTDELMAVIGETVPDPRIEEFESAALPVTVIKKPVVVETEKPVVAVEQPVADKTVQTDIYKRASEAFAERARGADRFISTVETQKAREDARMKGARLLMGEGLAVFDANTALSARTKQILLLRYGAVFPADPIDPTGARMSSEGPFSVRQIASRVGIHPRHVRRVLEDVSVQGNLPQETLFGAIPHEGRTAFTEPELETSVSHFGRLRPRRPGGRVEGPRQEHVFEDIVTEKRDSEGKLIGLSKERYLSETTRFGIRQGTSGGAVVPLETTYYDPVTGDRIGTSTGLFAATESLEKRVAAENALGIEPVPVPEAGPLPEPTVAETTLHEAAEEALKLKTDKGRKEVRVVRAHEKVAAETRGKPRQLELLRVGRFKAGTTLGDYKLYLGAVEAIGKPNISKAHWGALRPEQRLRHAVLRLSEAGTQSEFEYRRALRSYARRFRNVGEDQALLERMSRSNHVGRIDLLYREASRLHTGLKIITSTPETPSYFLLTELDTGRAYRAADSGTAALILHGRERRLLSSPIYQPEGFVARMDIPGGPTAPQGPPEAPPPGGPPLGGAVDGEFYGLPPRPPNVLERLLTVAWMANWRSLRDYSAHVAKVTGDQRFFDRTDTGLNEHEKARRKAETANSKLNALAKKLGVKLRSRDLPIGEAAAAVDLEASRIQRTAGGAAADLFVRDNEVRIYREMGLSENEIKFLQHARPIWDELFSEFGIGLEKYVYGYIARMKKRKLEDVGQPPESDVNFWNLLERSGELPLAERELRYSVIFERYARQGYKFLHLGNKPGSPAGGPIENIRALLLEHNVDPAAGGVPPKWARPFVELLRVLQGYPDERRVGAQIRTAGRLEQLRDLSTRADSVLEQLGTPERNIMRRTLKSYADYFGEKMTDPQLNTLSDLFLTLNRSRTFGFSLMRATRHVTQSGFFVMPRVGPRFYFRALREMVDPAKFEDVYHRAVNGGAVKPAYYLEYIGERSRLLTQLDRTTFMYRYLDIWERVLSYRSQELRAEWALQRFRRRGGGPQAVKRYMAESGLNLLHPAFRGRVLQPFLRGNYREAIELHSRLLVDHAIFDYTIANTPHLFAGVWGRVFGQYGRWPLAAFETMYTLAKYGGKEQLALYGAAAASIYGLGQIFGVQTAGWIPFIHSAGYAGGPATTLVEDFRDIWSGDPQKQDRAFSDFAKNPVAYVLGYGTRYLAPGWDIWRTLASDMNLSRRQRRLLGIPKPARDNREYFARLMGFKPVETGRGKHHPLLERVLSPAFEPLAEVIQGAAGQQ